MSKAQGNNTDTHYIDSSDIDPFFPSGFCGKEAAETDDFTRLYQYFYEQLSVDYLKQDHLSEIIMSIPRCKVSSSIAPVA